MSSTDGLKKDKNIIEDSEVYFPEEPGRNKEKLGSDQVMGTMKKTGTGTYTAVIPPGGGSIVFPVIEVEIDGEEYEFLLKP